MIGIDLFSGAGGMSFGATQAGINVILAVEKDIHAAHTYKKNHPACNLFVGDIHDFPAEDIRSIPKGNEGTIIFGGPPCQGFSYSNTRTRNLHNTTNWLFEEFLRFVDAWKPDFIVFENVRGITDTSGGVFLHAIVDRFRQLEYTLAFGVLNAKEYNVPQDRARFFLLGTKHHTPLSLPTPNGISYLTVSDAISDLPPLQNGASQSWLPYAKTPPSRYASQLRRRLGISPNHLVTRNAAQILRRYQHIPQGGNWQDIPEQLMENYRDRTRCHTRIYYRLKDSLAQTDDDDAEKYSLVLANPPFAGSLDYESTAKDLQQIVKTKKTELLFLTLFLRLLQTGGRAAVIVPDGVLFGSSKAHRTLRRILVEEQKLDAIVSMPSGVFKPYAGVSTAILLFTKTNSGGTDHVWFYDMQADGYSLDDKRTPQPEKSDLADILARWQNREAERKRPRTDQSFLVPKAEIAGNDYDLSINRYKEVEYEAVEYDPPKVILKRLAAIEEEIANGRAELERLL